MRMYFLRSGSLIKRFVFEVDMIGFLWGWLTWS